MQIRITKPVLEYGPVQWTRGQIVADLPDELAQQFIDRKEAILVPQAEQATMPAAQHASNPKPQVSKRPAPERAVKPRGAR